MMYVSVCMMKRIRSISMNDITEQKTTQMHSLMHKRGNEIPFEMHPKLNQCEKERVGDCVQGMPKQW